MTQTSPASATIAIMLIVIGLTEASIYAVLDFFGKPPTFAGVVVAVQGVGAIAGGVTTSRWVRRLGGAGTVTVGMAFLSLGLSIVALTSTLWAGRVESSYRPEYPADRGRRVRRQLSHVGASRR
jgi:hypothetical protein